MNIKPSELTDEHTLDEITNQWGNRERIYDDGYGPLWVHLDSMGITGIVRASMEDATSVAESNRSAVGSGYTIEEVPAKAKGTQ